MNSVWISAIGLCGATLIGAVLGFGIKELPHKWNDTVLGYCAGIMLAAAFRAALCAMVSSFLAV